MTHKIGTLLHEQSWDVASINAYRERLQEQIKKAAPAHLTHGVVIGNTVKKPFWRPRIAMERHGLVTGPTGAGKSFLLLSLCLQTLIGSRCHIVAFDYGDFVGHLMSFIGRAWIPFVHLLRISDREHPPSINIPVTPDNMNFVLNRLSTDPLTDRMILVLRRAIERLKGAVPDLSMMDLFNFLLKENSTTNEYRASIEGLIVRLEKYVSDPYIRPIACNRNPKFNLKKILSQNIPQIVLIDLNTRGRVPLSTAEILGRTLTSELDSAIFSRSPDDVPLIIFADEAPLYFDPSALNNILSHGRKYGASIWMTNQFIAQWGESFKAIAGNVGTCICFGAGPDDARRLSDVFIGYTPEEIVALPLHHCLVRVNDERGSHCFELKALLPPSRQGQDSSDDIIERSRDLYCSPLQAPVPDVIPVTDKPMTLSELSQSILAELRNAPKSVSALIHALGAPVGSIEKAKHELLGHSLIKIVRLKQTPGRGRPALLWTLTPQGRAYQGLPHQKEGKGGPQHGEMQDQIYRLLQEKGFNPSKERYLNGKNIDILFHGANDDMHGIEIQTSHRHVVENIQKDLQAGLRWITVVVPDVQVKDRINHTILGLPEAEQKTVRVVLFSHFFRGLEGDSEFLHFLHDGNN